MDKSLLIVTSEPNFSELLRQALGQAGYRVLAAKTKGEAIFRADEENCTLAFLDLDMGQKAVADIGRALRTLNPDFKLVLFSGTDAPPALDEIRPWVSLRKPFYLPDLLHMLSSKPAPVAMPSAPVPVSQPAKVGKAGASIPFGNTDMPWLDDVAKAAQHLTRLTLESSAQAALITRGDNLWAYAGQLSQAAAKELAVTVTRHWDGLRGSDLLRFVRLEATRAEHMLYATRLADDVVLALVFDAETPFSTIRTQASRLANSLSFSEPEAVEPSIAQQEQPLASYDASIAPSANEEEGNVEVPSIADILSDVPPPTPPASIRRQMEVRRSTAPHTNSFSRESAPALRAHDLLVSNQHSAPANQDLDQTVEHVVEDLDVTMPSKSRPRPETPVRRPAPGELDETRPHSITEVAGRVVLEPISPGLYNLTYACLLVPRFTSHYLTGDLADRLSEWVPQICIAFGWRLEFLAVRPEYIQWVVNVPPATSPGYLMRIMRQQTSEKVFTEFTRMKKENPSGDFWAPGYLIMGGTQPHPPQLVKDYIRQTRQQQGYSQPQR